MGRALHVAFIVLIACSLPALAMPTGTPLGTAVDASSNYGGTIHAIEPVTEPDVNVPERLEPGEDAAIASGLGETRIDIGTGLRGETEHLDARYRSISLEERLAAAESDAQRRTVIRNELSAYSALVSDLRQQEIDIARAYADDEIDERTLLLELGLIHARADAYEDALYTLDASADATTDIDVSSEIGVYRSEFETLQGPIRERIVENYRGDAAPITIFVGTATHGISLATLEDQNYNRETVRVDHWNPGGEHSLTSLTDAIERAETLYPWAFADERGSRSYGEASAAAYRASSDFGEGSIQIYLDRSTANVYREYQALDVNRISPVQVVNESENDLRLSLERTYQGGPTRITVTDSTSGEPIDATVSIANRSAGTTGDNGELWTIMPRGSVTVTATTPEADITINYTPSPPAPDNGSDD